MPGADRARRRPTLGRRASPRCCDVAGLHRFFALLMLAAVLLHAGVAWYYGYRWIFA